ncbi:MAG: hypothetical protein PHR16_16610 [Methylovulum sp.]|nr:hypothetical protein [Methylovulum sp.]
MELNRSTALVYWVDDEFAACNALSLFIEPTTVSSHSAQEGAGIMDFSPRTLDAHWLA